MFSAWFIGKSLMCYCCTPGCSPKLFIMASMKQPEAHTVLKKNFAGTVSYVTVQVCMLLTSFRVGHHATACPLTGKPNLWWSWWTELYSTDFSDCTPLHRNFLAKHDLSTPGCCPVVAGCCFAERLLCSVHTEQLPSAYLCGERGFLSYHLQNSFEWEGQTQMQKALFSGILKKNPNFLLHKFSKKESFLQYKC